MCFFSCCLVSCVGVLLRGNSFGDGRLMWLARVETLAIVAVMMSMISSPVILPIRYMFLANSCEQSHQERYSGGGGQERGLLGGERH